MKINTDGVILTVQITTAVVGTAILAREIYRYKKAKDFDNDLMLQKDFKAQADILTNIYAPKIAESLGLNLEEVNILVTRENVLDSKVMGAATSAGDTIAIMYGAVYKEVAGNRARFQKLLLQVLASQLHAVSEIKKGQKVRDRYSYKNPLNVLKTVLSIQSNPSWTYGKTYVKDSKLEFPILDSQEDMFKEAL